MTFYWWSHWFWITLLSNILLSIVFVHTYPSEDNTAIDYTNNKNDQSIKSVTRLYQTTTTLIWATTLPPNQMAPKPLVRSEERTKLQNIPRTSVINRTGIDASFEDGKEWSAAQDHSSSKDIEFKRSAIDSQINGTQLDREVSVAPSNQNKSSHIQATDQVLQHSIATLASKEEHFSNATRQEKKLSDFSVNNNFTNFSTSIASKNETSKLATTTTVKGKSLIPQASSSAATPSTPEIENVGDAPNSKVEWPLQDLAQSETQDVIGQKVPFTLENVNKEEEIIRAENEHRSRKSKVLSAEYKHINRFINYSTDSKSLLTRSASTAPVDYDSEGNISSEALAIRRTYFLDASTISAICFTIFGICCTMGTIGLVLYRRRFLNKPQALSEPDSSVYIDDSTMRDNSDEMYSLDNDSFLNSLEAMTIQNYWTDTVKHTKL